MYKINRELLFQMLKEMPEQKKNVLRNALIRNSILTSARTLENCTLTIYKEGYLIELEGTRCSFSVYAKDDDGELVFMRKPNKSKLHKLYEEFTKMWESDYRDIDI